MWDTLFSHDEPSRLSGGDGRKRQTKKNCRPNRGPGLVASLLYSTIWRQVRYVRICWCGVVSLGEIRHIGRHPFRMFADTSSGRDKEMLSQSRCPKCGAAGSPAADRCGSLCRSWRVEFPLGKETGKAKGEGLGRLSPCFWSMDGRLLGRNGFRRDGRAVFGARGQGLHGGRLLHGFGSVS